MTNSNNTMFITSEALTRVSKELVDKRTYDPTLITTRGEPVVFEGVASSISEANYFLKEKLSFEESEEIKVNVEGNFLTSENSSCLFYLTGTQNESGTVTPVALRMSENEVYIIQYTPYLVEDAIEYSEKRVTLFSDIKIKDNDRVYLQIVMTTRGINSLFVLNDSVYESHVELQEMIELTLYDTLFIGIDPFKKQEYWKGLINLNKLRVFKNNNLLYAPSKGNVFRLSKVLVSDGVYPLSNESVPILKHVYDCSVSEISRSNNNILLLVDFGSDVTLNIQEVGLYSTIVSEYKEDGTPVESSELLFSLIQGLSINKTDKLDYSLIIHVNLDLNVVNTTVLPKVVLKKSDNAKSKEFLRIKSIQSYTTVLLERMVRLNTLGIGNYKPHENLKEGENYRTSKYMEGIETPPRTMIDSKPVGVGYNRAQVSYREQKEYMLWESNHNATIRYGNVKSKFSRKERSFFSNESIELGKELVNSEGVATGFKTLSYVTSKVSTTLENKFSCTIAFSTSTKEHVQGETILCLANEVECQPLRVYLRGSKVCVSAGQLERVIVKGVVGTVLENVGNATFYRTRNSIEREGTKYYAWSYEGLDDSPLRGNIFTESRAPKQGDKVYVLSNSEGTGDTLEEANLIVENSVSGYIFNESLFNLEVDEKVFLKVEFNGEEYKFYRSRYGRDYVLCLLDRSYYLPDGSRIEKYEDRIVSATPMNLANRVIFGVNYNAEVTSDPFYGSIYLADAKFPTSTYIKSFMNTEVINDKELKDFYHFPQTNLSCYKVNNLSKCSKEYCIGIEENVVKGNLDSISMNSSEGFTLCVKVSLQDDKDKVIVLKRNLGSEDIYFILQIVDKELLWIIYYDANTIRLSKKLTLKNRSSYLENPITLSLTCSAGEEGNHYKMYRNTTIEDVVSSIGKCEMDATNGSITNYIESTLEAEENYVSDILYFKGELSEDDIYYVCNALDTNF